MTEKWLKFFTSAQGKIETDAERALKNDHCPEVDEFIKDEYKTFNDRQLIKAHNLLCRGVRYHRDMSEVDFREEIHDKIINKILSGNFDMQKGNLLAMFAESFLISMELNTKDSAKAREPLGIMDQ